MKPEEFNDISMNGRMAYAILCTEKYLLATYPNENWSILSDLLWKATSMYWDEWDNIFIEIIPEYLFEFNTYEKSEFEKLSEKDYKAFTALFEGKSDVINHMLMNLHRLQEVYSYSSIPGNGIDASNIVIDQCSILEQNNILLPSIDTVSFSHFNEKNGWGERFDGSPLSLILNN